MENQKYEKHEKSVHLALYESAAKLKKQKEKLSTILAAIEKSIRFLKHSTRAQKEFFLAYWPQLEKSFNKIKGAMIKHRNSVQNQAQKEFFLAYWPQLEESFNKIKEARIKHENH